MVNKKTTPKAPFSKIAFTSILCLTLVTFLGLGWQTWSSHKNVKMFQEQHFRIQELIGTIMHLDEVLTMSARMGTKTGDFKWEERYLKFEPQLGAAISEAKRLVPAAFILKAAIQTDTANTKLVAMEKRAFELVRQGQKEEASAILFSEEYQGQKQIYAQGMKQVKTSMQDHITDVLNEYRRHELFTIVTILTVLPVLFFAFIYIILLTRRRYVIEQKLSEDKLDKYRILFDNITDLAYICDTEGNVLFLNKVFEKFSGHKPEKFIGKSFAPLFDGENLKKAMDLYSRALSGENPQQEVRFKDTGILCEYKSMPLLDEKGEIVGVIGIARDITERKLAEKELKKTATLLTNVMNSTPDLVFVKDLELRTIMCNKTFATAVGKRPEDMIGKTDIENGWNPELVRGNSEKGIRGFENDDRQALSGKEVHNTSDPANVGNEIRFFDTQKMPLYSEEGQIFGLLGVARDITERKRLEDELKESNKTLEERVAERTEELVKTNKELELFKNLIDQSNDSIFVIDAVTIRFLDVNNKACKTLGYMRKELLNMKVEDIDVMPKQLFLENLEKLKNREYLTVVSEHKRKDNTTFPVEVNIKTVTFKEKSYMIAVARDITERKRAEEILHGSEAKYSRLIENLRDNYIFYSHNTNGILTYISPSITNLLGYTHEEFLTHYSEYMTDSPGNKDVIKYTDLSISGIKQPPYEVELYHKDGSIRTLKVQEVPVFDNNHNVIAVEGIAEDITKHKHAEEKFVNYQTQLKRLSSALSLTEERERRHISEELHGRIGQALTVIKMKLEELQEPQTDTDTDLVLSETCGLLDQAIKDTRTLTFELSPPVLYELGFEPAVEWLVDQFKKQHSIAIDFIGGGVAGLGFEPGVEWFVDQFKKQHNISIDFVGDGLTRILGEDVSFFLFKSVRELLFNVVKHARAHKIKVTLLKKDNKIRIDIDDDGVGFDFSKTQFSVNDLSGFGLFSIRERMEHFGGNLDIKSEPGEGTCVTLTMPLKQKEGDASAK